MHVFRFLLPVLFVAGCAAVSDEDPASSSDSLSADGKKDDGVSVAYGPCAMSRASILASVSPARAEALARGFAWLDADVPFSMRATYESYRTDCSGFVSMCWSLRAPGLNTRTLGSSGSGSHKLRSYDELVPADALVDAGKHSVIFLGWNDSAHNGICVLEQSSTKNDMQFRVRMTSSLKADGFVPVRADQFANDTVVNRPTETIPDTTPNKPPGDPEGENKVEAPAPAPVPVCRSLPVASVCADAMAAGVECGRVVDNCGRVVDCRGMAGFGCSASETCGSDKKCTSTCTPPKYKEDICYAAQLKSGVECGKVPDGCGGTVDCDDLPYFGCKGGAVCGETQENRCPKTDSKPSGSEDDADDESDRLTEGDPGEGDDDESDSTPSSTRSPASDDEDEDDAPNARKRSGATSSGCSTAPLTAGGGAAAGFGGPALGLLLLLGARRRRSKAS